MLDFRICWLAVSVVYLLGWGLLVSSSELLLSTIAEITSRFCYFLQQTLLLHASRERM
jgi:hypothetical protein